MKRSWLPAFLLLCTGLCLQKQAFPSTYYLKEEVFAPSGPLKVSDLLSPADPADNMPGIKIPGDIRIEKNRLSLIPAGFIRRRLARQNSGSIILIGNSTNLLPGQAAESCREFYSALGRFFLPYAAGPDYRLDVLFPAPPLLTGDCPSAEYHFTLLEHSLETGYLCGKTRLYYTRNRQQGNFLEVEVLQTPLPGSAAEESSWTAPPGSPQLVRGGEMIDILFVKKNIRLKLQGRAYASGPLGATVTVRPSTTNKRFSGIVTGLKEVRVEID